MVCLVRKKKSPHNPNKVSVQIVESVRNAHRVCQAIVRSDRDYYR